MGMSERKMLSKVNQKLTSVMIFLTLVGTFGIQSLPVVLHVPELAQVPHRTI